MAGLVPACPGQPHLSLRFPNSVQVPINRRAFVRGLAGFVAGWPACAYAQTPRSEYASLERWKIIPSIVVVSAADEPRLSAVREAIDFWNAELSKLGSPFRLGEVTHAIDIIPVDYLYAAFHRTPRTVPDIIRRTNADVIISLSDAAALRAFTAAISNGRKLVAVPGHEGSRWRLPNGARNVIAHELGHVIGLGHNDDPAALMCGGQPWCHFAIPRDGFFPLTKEEQIKLLEMYPASWQAGPSKRWKADPPAGTTPG